MIDTVTEHHAATWIDDEIFADDDPHGGTARLAADRGLIVGDGLYETLRLRGGRPVLFRAHLQRMEETAEALGFPLPGGFRDRVVAAIDDLHPRVGEPPMAWLRVTVTRGVGPPGLAPPPEPRPTVLVRMVAVEPGPLAPQKAWVVDRPRTDPADPLAGRKTISSMRWVLANQEARRHGADVAIVRTIDGDLAEADTATLYVVLDGTVVTPPLSRGILPSTTREWIFEQLRDDGRPARDKVLHRAELVHASEVFVSSSVAGIRPLVAVDERPFPPGGPVCAWLSERYEALPADEDWR